jgi:hypothetical protein
MLIKDSGSSDFPPTPAGLHPAVCYQLVDCGTHEEVFQGQQHDRHVLYIVFELPTLTIEIDGITKPRAISQKYTKSMHIKSNLRKDLESWRGKPFREDEARAGFELKTILGANCQLNIIHNVSGDKTYANISTIVPLGAGMTKHDPFNELVCYDISDGASIPETVPTWLKDKIMGSLEMNVMGQQGQSGNRIIGADQEPWESEPKQEPREPGTVITDPNDDDIPF